MKRLFLLAVVLAAGFTAMAQQKAEEVITVSTVKHNFGKIRQGQPVFATLTITNISDKPVVIENAWATCGCTTPEYSKEPVGAKKTTTLKVGYNAAAMGVFEKDVFVKIAGVNEPMIIKITGEVVAATSADASESKPLDKSRPAKKG